MSGRASMNDEFAWFQRLMLTPWGELTAEERDWCRCAEPAADFWAYLKGGEGDYEEATEEAQRILNRGLEGG